jgi:GT2 family glycosyltransferase/glycosyltransferase involved in cell wall biosynthesis
LARPEPLLAGGHGPGGTIESVLRLHLLQRLHAAARSAGSQPAARTLQQIRSALRAGALDQALRHADRAWRHQSDGDAAVLAPIYGGLLALEARDHDAALRLLQRAADLTRDPDVAAQIALTLLRLRRGGEARTQLEAALAAYGVAPGSLLFQVAGEVMLETAGQAPGWIGRGPELELVGELAAAESSNVLDISLDGRPAFSQLLRPLPHEGRRAFRFQTQRLSLTARLQATVRGAALIGSGVQVAPDFGLDGRIDCRGGKLSGWVRLGWAPARPVRLRIEDERGVRITAKTGGVAQSVWQWPFQVDLRAARLRGHQLKIAAELPDGRWQALPDSPLLLEPALRLPGGRPRRLPNWGSAVSRPRLTRALTRKPPLTDVIIPVYRGREHALACINAVLATLDSSARLVVVDDASDDRQLAAALDALAAAGRLTLLRNPENQGFVASVNRAMALHAAHDVVLLNSDTLVFDDWLTRLRAAAYSAAAVGTVTPLSNSGSIASYPHALGAAMAAEDGAALHALAASTHSGMRVAIPVGVGFCLYVRRDCLLDVGAFDAAVFGMGYGEETDFCLRARRRGWSHQLAADVYVYHAGGASFGARRAALLDRSQRLINLRHPRYDAFIASFLVADPLQPLRRQLDERRLMIFDGRFVLLVTLALVGGVDRFVAERCRELRTQGLHPLVLRPAAAGDTGRCELWTDALALPNLRYDIPGELAALSALLGRLRLEAIEIQHFLHLDARVIDAVRALPLPYDVFVHDYAWICPRVTLIDGTGRYCGEPAVTVCHACVRRHGSNLGERISAAALRERSASWLRGARRVICPSADAAARLRRHFPGLDVRVQPHAAPVVPVPLPARTPRAKTFRVALIGAIGEHKGYRLLLQCARDARERRLPLEFVVIGYSENDAPLLKTGKVFITGRYTEAEAPHLLRRERPDIAWLASVWPETWCYTLDYALQAGLPVAAFDLGAVAERVRSSATGVLMPIGLQPREINDRLLALARGQRPASANLPASVESPLVPPGDAAKMGATQQGEKTMNNASNAKPAQAIQQEGLSASVQVLPLPAGLYLFSVTAADPVTAKTAGLLSLPAVHVGLGPGVRAAQVEFIAGPSTEGAWLFAPGDLLVTRINGTGATLVITSLRAPGGEVLSIKVERLEARASAPDAARPAPAAVPPPSAPTARKRAVKPAAKAVSDGPLPLQIEAHIRGRGDMNFADVPWAGRVAPGLWIESFSLRPLQGFSAHDIEYKGLTGSGFETPWLSDEKMCGTKGMSVPLVGFAVRLKPSAAAAAYDCEYSGYFQSRVTVGPLRNGAPCRSTVANDPLEGIQVRLVRRSPLPSSALAAAAKSAAPAKRNNAPRPTTTPAKRRAQVPQARGRSARATRRHSTRRP